HSYAPHTPRLRSTNRDSVGYARATTPQVPKLVACGHREGEGAVAQLTVPPTSTIGPVGAAEPPAGSIDTAKAVTPAGFFTDAMRAATACSALTAKRPAGSGGP